LRSHNIALVPEEALRAIDSWVEEAGGEWHEPAGHAGAIGRTMFDLPASVDGSVTASYSSPGGEGVPVDQRGCGQQRWRVAASLRTAC
jgi:hypothetical protein